ncbi:unnamed protein product [Moneuplotes crassus]|uniref:HTH cro/C1-type domain-containing protein n=2 Tax=Euplotes crassus TaxID=5936 RepID=A0AAD1XY36_EUPCR|nr:unnamed protein product [Moneuplotes crassus]
MDWTEVSKPKKKKVVKKTPTVADDQKSLMKEMQGFRNWSEKETKTVIPANTGRSKLGAGVSCDAYIREDFEEKKREKVNGVLANNVRKARENSGMTQAELAQACSVKTYEISEVEKRTAFYDPNLINMIERVLDTHIERGRAKNRGNKKRKKKKKENEVW